MADAYMGEVRAFAFNYAPEGWMICNGGLLSISQYPALYSVLGIRYGGDGKTTFGLPNLQGQLGMGAGTGVGLTPRVVAQKVGSENVMLTLNEVPAHQHSADAKTETDSPVTHMHAQPSASSYLTRLNMTASTAGAAWAKPPISPATLSPLAVGPAGGGAAHENRQPYLPLLFCMCIDGYFPPHS
jgi:microcystin-dependent protein